jgi:hypothetical protein
MVNKRQQFHPRARIFSYLVKDNGQIFQGKLGNILKIQLFFL